MKVLRQSITALFVATLWLAMFGNLSPTQAAVPGGTLNPLNVPKYVTPLVIPPVMPKTGITTSVPQADYDIAVRQFQQQILPGGIWNTAAATTGLAYPATTVWSYGSASDPMPDSSLYGGGAGIAPAANSSFNYPSFTVENTSNVLNKVRWINELVKDPLACYYGALGDGSECNYLSHLLPVDQTLHWANPNNSDCISHGGMTLNPLRTDCETLNQLPYMGPVPIVTHVHGAHVNPESDGYPEAWWLADADNIPGTYAMRGKQYGQYNTANLVGGSAFFGYENDQEAATIWYHDHSMGMTRLNVYAGPAGFWLIRGGLDNQIDDVSTIGTPNDGVLPGPAPQSLTDNAAHTTLALNVEADLVRQSIREIPIAIQDRSFDWVDANGNIVAEGDANAVGTKLWYPIGRPAFDGFDGPYLGDPGGSASDISKIWNPEAFFNTFVVNGVTWPRLKVAPERYRFRLLNGSNSRTLNIAMKILTSSGQPTGFELPFFQIGGDQGFLPAVTMIRTGFMQQLTPGEALPNAAALANPNDMQALLLMPAERADVIVDFTGLPDGTRVRITNTAGDGPFGGLDPQDIADPSTTGQVMEFVVGGVAPGAASTPVTNLKLPVDTTINALPVETNTRKLSLNEMVSDTTCVAVDPITGELSYLYEDPAAPLTFEEECLNKPLVAPPAGWGTDVAGPRQALLGNTVPAAGVPGANGFMTTEPGRWMDPITLKPEWGSTEVWEIYNNTMDAHPIHVHLVRFQILDREDLTFDEAGNFALTGTTYPPRDNELGFKDTVVVFPGQVARLKATFDIAGLYVWHCHIVEHEDNEMMLPFEVVYGAAPAPASITVPATNTTGSYTVSWEASATPGATYTLQESTDPNFVNGVTTFTNAVSPVSITGKTNGTYYYRVMAENAPMTASVWTTGSNPCVVSGVLNAPASLSVPATSSDGNISLLAAYAGASVTYIFEESLNGGPFAQVYSGVSRYVALTGRANGTYTYQVKVSQAGFTDSAWTAGSNPCVVSVVTPTLNAPATLDVPATSTDGNIPLLAAYAGASVTYIIEESFNGGPFAQVYSGVSRYVALTGRINGTYTYQVKVSQAGFTDSAWTAGSNPAVVSGVLNAPASLTVPPTSSTGSIDLLAANAGAGVTYIIQESVNGGAFTQVYSGTNSNVTLTGRANGTYTYQVKVSQAGFADSAWTAGSNPCVVSGLLNAPASLTVPPTSSTGSIDLLAANAGAGVTYIIQESVNGGAFNQVYSGTNSNVTLNGRINGTYTYQVKVSQAGFVDSVWTTGSNPCVVSGVLNAPASLSVPATSSDGNISLLAAYAGASVTYIFEESLNGGPFAQVYSGVSRYVALTGRANGTYTYQVKVSQAGFTDSAWTAGSNPCVVSLVTPALNAPATLDVPATSSDGNIPLLASYAGAGVTYIFEESFNGGPFTQVYSGVSRYVGLTGRATGTYTYQVKVSQAGFTDSAWTAGSNPCVVSLVTPTLNAPATLDVPATPTNGTIGLLATYAGAGVTYIFEESFNGGPFTQVYSGLSRYVGLTGRATGTYTYQVKVSKAGFTDSGWTAGANPCVVP